MKAAVYYGHKDIRVMEVERPKASPGHVVVQVAYGGICGTDRHEYAGPNFIPTNKPHRLTGKTAPLTLGHEFTGLISEVGEGVEGWQIGDRVTASGNLVCGECYWCKSGRINICEKLGFLGISKNGAFAEYVEVLGERLFKIPDNVSLRTAILAEPLACGIHATKLIGDLSGCTVAVVGTGIIGLSCVIAAKRAGAERILVSGISNDKEGIVKKLGAYYVDSTVTNPVEYLKKINDGRLADVVYECIGSDQTLDLALNMSRVAARIMIMGVYEKPPRFNMNLFQEGERILLSSQAYIDEMGIMLEIMKANGLPLTELITAEIDLEGIVEDGFEALIRNGEKHIKVIINIGRIE